jgi:hypothetical protein
MGGLMQGEVLFPLACFCALNLLLLPISGDLEFAA